MRKMSMIWNSLSEEVRNTLFCMARTWKEGFMQEATEVSMKGYLQALVDLKMIEKDEKQDFLLFVINDIVTDAGTFNPFCGYEKEEQA